MADNTEEKHVADKVIGWAKGLAVAIGGLMLVDQSKLVGETVPAIWEDFKDLAARGLVEVQIAYEHAAIWFQTNWRRAKWVTLIWWVFAASLLVAGTWGTTQNWSAGATMTMRLVGIYLFAGYWYVAAAVSKPFYYGWQAVKSLARGTANAVTGTISHHASKVGVKIPALNLTAKDAAKIEESALALQRFFYTLACIVLLFGTFFASSGTPEMALRLLKYGVPLAFVAALSGKFGWKTESGWKLLKLGALIAFAVMILLDFTVVGDWYAKLNRSETIALALFVIPSSLWLAAAFWKDKSDALKAGAKVMSVVCAITLVVLWIKGSITTHELASTSDETAAKMNKIQKTATDRVLDKALDVVTPGNGTHGTPNVSPPPAGNGMTGQRYAGNSDAKPQEASRTTTHTRRKITVPPVEAPKHYTDPVQETNDLEALGY